MTQSITSFDKAKALAIKLKQEYSFGTDKCPVWFSNVCFPVEQTGEHSLGICIPSWQSITNEEAERFMRPIDGVRVNLRVVTPSKYKSEKHD